MTHAVRIHAYGGPEVLRWEEHDPGPPGPGTAQVRHTAVGLNYIDVYDRTGLYAMPLPGILGREAAGVVTAVGRRVQDIRPGDRVAYVLPQPGAYCQVRNVPAERLVRLPRAIADADAAALMLKGLTAQYLLRRTYRVKAGETILVHAAAGGVGLLLCQWAKALGARVIGVVGSEAKAGLARRHGCWRVLVTGDEPLAPRVRELTRGQGVAVVYDSVGKDTFMDSLDALRPLGMMVSYGNASGPPPAFSALELARRGSLFLTRPSLFTYVERREDLVAAARELFRAVGSGAVKVRIGQRYPLAEAARAHSDLEARRTTGSTVLEP
jgi:NADPH:quinone reductase